MVVNLVNSGLDKFSDRKKTEKIVIHQLQKNASRNLSSEVFPLDSCCPHSTELLTRSFQQFVLSLLTVCQIYRGTSTKVKQPIQPAQFWGGKKRPFCPHLAQKLLLWQQFQVILRRKIQNSSEGVYAFKAKDMSHLKLLQSRDIFHSCFLQHLCFLHFLKILLNDMMIESFSKLRLAV